VGELTALAQTPSWISGGLLLRGKRGGEGKGKEGKWPKGKGRKEGKGGGNGQGEGKWRWEGVDITTPNL